jgi:hypothetical protein
MCDLSPSCIGRVAALMMPVFRSRCTDAALEGNDLVGSVSAVMFDRVLGQPAVWQFFGSEIVGPELSKLQTGSMKVITVLEVLPVVAAIKCWRDRMLLRRVFVFVDNDGARHCLLICPANRDILGPCWLALPCYRPSTRCSCGTPEFRQPAIVLMILPACSLKSSG